MLLVAYIKDQLMGKCLARGQTAEVSLYGKPQQFKVVKVASEFEESSTTGKVSCYVV